MSVYTLLIVWFLVSFVVAPLVGRFIANGAA